MEELDLKFHQKYTRVKKQKLLDDELQRKREAEYKVIYDGYKDWVSELKKDNRELNEMLVDKKDELEKSRQEFCEEIRSRDIEILRLKRLLDEKARKNNSTATGSASEGKVKRVQLIENAPQSSPTEESEELECSRRRSCISGNGTKEIPSADILQLMIESLVRMKVSVNHETEMFSFSACHEASGYSFTLTWLEKEGEWLYKLSSMGTLDRIVVDWMKEDTRFSMNMSRMFFQRISNIIAKG